MWCIESFMKTKASISKSGGFGITADNNLCERVSSLTFVFFLFCIGFVQLDALAEFN